ncbi:MAG: hypothetical protein AB1792_03780 [Candidatus Zixiibacteriota bacterium]
MAKGTPIPDVQAAGDSQANRGHVVDLGAELLRWRSHPVRSGGIRLVWVIVVVCGIPALLAMLYGLFFGLLGLVILGGSLGSYFLPTDFVIFERGIQSRFLRVSRSIPWTQFRSFYRDRNGVLLSPFPRPSRLENFRGLYLRFDGRREDVMALVAAHITVPGGEKAPERSDPTSPVVLP